MEVLLGTLGIMWLIFIIVSISGLIFWLWSLFDILFNQDEDKAVWFLVTFIFSLLGALVYYFVARKKRKTLEKQLAAVTAPPVAVLDEPLISVAASSPVQDRPFEATVSILPAAGAQAQHNKYPIKLISAIAAAFLAVVGGGGYLYSAANAKQQAHDAAMAKAKQAAMQAEIVSARKEAENARRENDRMRAQANEKARQAARQAPVPHNSFAYGHYNPLLNPAPTPQRSSIEARNLLLAENARKTREANALQKPLSRDKAIVDFMK